jgi:acetyl-CoA synthetase
MDTYLNPYKGFYFCGDGVQRDENGYYWIQGRVDDVMNISGHRMSTAEIESALILHPACSEAAVVGIPDDITGQSIVCFCAVHGAYEADLGKQLAMQVRTHIGPFATPKHVIIVKDLPKTRSGKIMRRILRKIACHEIPQESADDAEVIRQVLGDTSTLADSSVVSELIKTFYEQYKK